MPLTYIQASPEESRCDPLLLPLLQARNAVEAERSLDHLVTTVADPVVIGILQNKLRVSLTRAHGRQTREELDAEDMRTQVLEQIVRRLRDCMARPREAEIRDFVAYVAQLTFNAFRAHLVLQSPQRARVEAQVRLLLTRLPHLALWSPTADEGKRSPTKRQRLCGLAVWRDQGKTVEPGDRVDCLRHHPEALAQQLAVGGAAAEMPLSELLERLFRWIGHPAELTDIVTAVACLRGIEDYAVHSGGDEEEGTEDKLLRVPDPQPSVADQVALRAELNQLWQEIREMKPESCAALLLDTRGLPRFLALFPALGIATIQELAHTMDMSPEALHRFWNDLPFDDATIADILSVSRAQVTQLRFAARNRLAQRMKSRS